MYISRIENCLKGIVHTHTYARTHARRHARTHSLTHLKSFKNS